MSMGIVTLTRNSYDWCITFSSNCFQQCNTTSTVEDVDGEKSDSLVPEESPLLPGPVKMHRKADTSDENSVSIKNHFSREDFQDLPTEIDLDLKNSEF